MEINKGILHILDFNSGLSVFSENELDFSKDVISIFLEKHLEKIQTDSGQRQGVFSKDSEFLNILKGYLNKETDFVTFSKVIANNLYDLVSQSESLDNIDFIVADFIDNDIRYIGLLMMNSKTEYTHNIINIDGSISNEIITHHAILPNTGRKIDTYAIINCNDFLVGFVDKPKKINGEDVWVLPERLLKCTSQMSVKEVIKTVNKVTTKICEEHGADTTMALSKVKSYLVENAEESEYVSPVELGQEVFEDNQIMQQEFEREIKEKKVPEDIKIEKSVAIRTGRNHKIRTDTGIEITVPTEYFENPEYIEFVHNPDGTISIELKNIGKIINR